MREKIHQEMCRMRWMRNNQNHSMKNQNLFSKSIFQMIQTIQ